MKKPAQGAQAPAQQNSKIMLKRTKTGPLTACESRRYEELLFANGGFEELSADERGELLALECRLFMYGEEIPGT